jgi:hypothetical protein
MSLPMARSWNASRAEEAAGSRRCRLTVRLHGVAVPHLLMRRAFCGLRDISPCNRIANVDRTLVDYFPEDSTAPIGSERLPQARSRFVHSFAGCQLTTDLYAARANEQHTAARVRQVNAADKNVRAPADGARVVSDICSRRLPGVPRQEGDLATPATPHTPLHSSPGYEPRFENRVHGSAVGAFDPEFLYVASHAPIYSVCAGSGFL